MTAPQRDEAWLRSAPLTEIKTAFERGELADVLGPDPAAYGQLTEADLKDMTPEQITAAQAAGKLNALMGAPMPLPAEGQLEQQHLDRMTPEEITAAHGAGRLDALLGRTPAGGP